jgi:hypothetical protein
MSGEREGSNSAEVGLFHQRAEEIAEALRGRVDSGRASAFENIESNAAFVALVQGLLRREAGMSGGNDPAGRMRRLLEEALPLIPETDREIAVGLVACASALHLDPARLGLKRPFWASAAFGRWALLVSMALVMVALLIRLDGLPFVVQMAEKFQRYNSLERFSKPDTLAPALLTLVGIVFTAYLYAKIIEARQVRDVVENAHGLLPSGLSDYVAPSRLGARTAALGLEVLRVILAPTAGLVFYYVLGGWVNRRLNLETPGAAAAWGTCQLFFAFVVGLWFYYSSLPADFSRTHGFERLVARVAGWRDKARERMAAASAEKE